MLDHNNPNLKLNYLADLSDIPEELKKQLARCNPSKTNLLIEHFIEALTYFGGTASLDEILVYAYRRHKFVHRRSYAHLVVGELRKTGIIEPVEKRRGTYRLVQEPSQEQKPWEPQPDLTHINVMQQQAPEPEQAPQEAKKKEPTDLDKIYLEALKDLGGQGSNEEILKKVMRKYKTNKKALEQTMQRLHKKGFVERIEPGAYELSND